MKLPFLVSIATYLRRPSPKPATVKQVGIQARAIRHLIAHGKIDAWTIIQMGTTDAHKMLSRFRRFGLLYDADDVLGHHLAPNRSGHGYHRIHRWTGKYPHGWSDGIRFDVPECRSRKRGGR